MMKEILLKIKTRKKGKAKNNFAYNRETQKL